MVLTQHCEEVASKRAISMRQIDIVHAFGKCKPHRDNVVYYMLDKNIKKALDKGIINKQEADKLKNIFVVWDQVKDQVVTTYRPNKKKQKEIMKRIA